MKQKLSDYIAENYAGKGPCHKTMVKRIKDPDHPLQGEFDGIWWIHVSPPSTGNEIADNILSELGCL